MRTLALTVFVLSLGACTTSSFFNDPTPHYGLPSLLSPPCRADETPTTFMDASGYHRVCTPVGCAAAADCPLPTTGDATLACYMPGGVTQCRLRCTVGVTACPTGMSCVLDADGTGLSACAYSIGADAGL